jgi:hypothetical protein
MHELGYRLTRDRNRPMKRLCKESRKEGGCPADRDTTVEKIAGVDEAQNWREGRKSYRFIRENAQTFDKVPTNVTASNNILMAEMEGVRDEVRESIGPIHKDMEWVSCIEQDRFYSVALFITKVPRKIIRLEELFRATFMTERWTARGSIEFRKGVYRDLGLMRREDVTLVVTRDRRHEGFGFHGINGEVARHLHGDLSGQKGMRSYTGVIGGLKGVGVGRSHTLVRLEVLSRWMTE